MICGYLLGLAGFICALVVGGGIAYFVIRDTFRFGRRGIPVSWAIVIIALFSAFGFWAGRFWGLLVAPVLAVAYSLGYRQARRDAAARDSQHHQPSA
jgi:hypothetical protein